MINVVDIELSAEILFFTVPAYAALHVSERQYGQSFLFKTTERISEQKE